MFPIERLNVWISSSSALKWRRRFQAAQPIIGIGRIGVAHPDGIDFVTHQVDGVQKNFNDTTCPFCGIQVEILRRRNEWYLVTTVLLLNFVTPHKVKVSWPSARIFTERPIIVCTEDMPIEEPLCSGGAVSLPRVFPNHLQNDGIRRVQVAPSHLQVATGPCHRPAAASMLIPSWMAGMPEIPKHSKACIDGLAVPFIN